MVHLSTLLSVSVTILSSLALALPIPRSSSNRIPFKYHSHSSPALDKTAEGSTRRSNVLPFPFDHLVDRAGNEVVAIPVELLAFHDELDEIEDSDVWQAVRKALEEQEPDAMDDLAQ